MRIPAAVWIPLDSDDEDSSGVPRRNTALMRATSSRAEYGFVT